MARQRRVRRRVYVDPDRIVDSGHGGNRVVRQGVHRRPPRPPRPQASGRLQPRRAQAVRVPSALRRRPAAALVHRGHPRPAPPPPGHARRRVCRPRGRPQAGRHRGVQPVGVRPDQYHRLAECHRGVHRRRGHQGRRALDGQGLLPDQPLRRDEAHRGQALHHRQPLRRRLPDPLFRRSVRKRHCPSPTCDAPASSSPCPRRSSSSSTPSSTCKAASSTSRASPRCG